MENRVITGVIGVFVVICLVGAALVPLIDSWAEGEKQTNEGAGWLRMDYQEITNAASAFTIQGAYTDDGLQVSNYTASTPDVQTGEDNTIIYASSNLAAWMQDGVIRIMGTDLDGNIFIYEPEDYFQISKSPNYHPQLVIDDAEDPIALMDPTWAYIPKSSGAYGFFTDGTPVKTQNNRPLASVGGGFAGVYAYNDITRYAGLGLSMVPEYDEDGNLIGTSWQKVAAPLTQLEPFDPSSITITPLDPSVLDPITLDPGSGSAGLMSVPTPTYVDGEWGYKLETVDNQQKAVIQSYSGSGGNIVVPSTVGGYDVYRFGNLPPASSSSNSQVIDNSSISANSTLTLPEGLVQIGNGVCQNMTNLTGTLTIPSTVTAIGYNAFRGCTGFTGSLTIPNSVTTIYANAFYQCAGFTGTIAIPDSVTTLGSSVFSYCTGLTGISHISANIDAINAFSYCTGLTGTLVIPETIKTIGISAFRECTGLTGLVLPDGLDKIDRQAFYKCTGLTGTLTIPDTVTFIGQENFYNTNFYGTLIVPGSVTGIYSSAFVDNDFDTAVFCNGVGSTNWTTGINNAHDLKTLIIATDSTPAYNTIVSDAPYITEVLDLSDTIDYSANRYGIPATATVSDSIGDSLGYISFVEIGSDPILPAGAAALMVAIPVVIFGALIAVGAAIFIRRE